MQKTSLLALLLAFLVGISGCIQSPPNPILPPTPQGNACRVTSDEFYYYFNGKQSLELSTNELIAEFDSNATKAEIDETLQEALSADYNYYSLIGSLYAVQLKQCKSETEIKSLVANLNKSAKTHFTIPVLYTKQGQRYLITNVLILKSKVDKQTLEAFNAQNHATIVYEFKIVPNLYTIRINLKDTNKSLLEIANAYYENGLVEYVESDQIGHGSDGGTT